MYRKISEDTYYTFDDVLLVPQYSEILSRSEVDLSVSLSKGIRLDIPVIPANMKSVVSAAVAEELFLLHGMCFLHRFCSVEEQKNILLTLKDKYGSGIFNHIGISIGSKIEDYRNVEMFNELGVDIVCVDLAHGHSKNCGNIVRHINKNLPKMFCVAGNVATGDGAEYLWDCGADAVKSGVGNGSICSTRMQTGHGFPQLSALMLIADRKSHLGLKDRFIIADGGCAKVGDLVKSLCLADLVMTGNLFAGAEETPGDIIIKDEIVYKAYEGSSTHKKDHIEGFKAMVPAKGKVKEIVKEMTEGISSGCSYSGARNLLELQKKSQFIKITSTVVKENGAHDVKVRQ